MFGKASGGGKDDKMNKSSNLNMICEINDALHH
jgi:hypothetical protein